MMYWRVRKYGTQEMLKQYGVHIALAISLFFNLVLLITRPDNRKNISAEVKADFDQFARRVTQHILDTSYISYENATAALIDADHGELAPSVISQLKRQQQLPRDIEELKATIRTYASQKRISAVRIDSVDQGEANAQSFIPIDVRGVVAVRTAEENDPGPVPFHFRYFLGVRPNSQTPIVAGFQDLSPPAH